MSDTTIRLVGANLNYSSWTTRAWLALRYTGLSFRFVDVQMKTNENWKERILSFSGAGKVPVLIHGQLSIHESLAICEYLNELCPEARLWPEDRALRARGRAIAAEMATSFQALRSAMPMNLRRRSSPKTPLSAVQTDIERVFDIWTASLDSLGGPFLLGEFSIADCMYFPVATRFRTYGVELPTKLAEYSGRLFALPAVQELEALAQGTVAIPEYDVAIQV